MQKYRLVSFADGTKDWSKSLRRLGKEGKNSNYFSRIELYNLERLSIESPDFFERHREFIKKNNRGFGYWIWKPEIIRLVLTNLTDEEDGIVYLDAGCTINVTNEARLRLNEYFEIAEEHGGLFFTIIDHPAKKWTKRDLQIQFAANNDELEQDQCAGTAFLLSKSKKSMELLDLWESSMEFEDYRLLDDSESNKEEPEAFISHRHDQAILNFLARRLRFATLRDETFFTEGFWTNQANRFPFWATRTRTAIPKYSRGPFWTILRHFENLMFEFKNSESKFILFFYMKKRFSSKHE